MPDFTTIRNSFIDTYMTGTNLPTEQIALQTGNVMGQDWSKIRHVDRTLYGGPGRVIFSEARDYRHDGDSGYPTRAWKNNSYAETGDTKKYVMVRSHGIIHRIPNPFPGSANNTSPHDGISYTDGWLACQALAKNAEVAFKIRQITIGGTGTSTVGAWSNIYTTHSRVTGGGVPRYDWQEAQLLYPTGAEVGTLIELQISFRQVDENYPAYLAGVMVYEPRLTTVA